jgi:hypothetical protein
MARVEIVGRDEGAACFRPDAVASGDLHETLAPGDDHERRGDTCFGKDGMSRDLLSSSAEDPRRCVKRGA